MRTILFFAFLMLAASCASPQYGCGYTWRWPEYDRECMTPVYSHAVYHTDDYSDTIRSPLYETTQNGMLVLTSVNGFIKAFTWGEGDTLYNSKFRPYLYGYGRDSVTITAIDNPTYIYPDMYVLHKIK